MCVRDPDGYRLCVYTCEKKISKLCKSNVNIEIRYDVLGWFAFILDRLLRNEPPQSCSPVLLPHSPLH